MKHFFNYSLLCIVFAAPSTSAMEPQECETPCLALTYEIQKKTAWPIQRKLIELRKQEKELGCKCFPASGDYDDRLTRSIASFEKAREHAAACDQELASAHRELKKVNLELEENAKGIKEIQQERAANLPQAKL